jgi:hypothetical protein
MAPHFLGMGTAKADGPNMFLADGVDKAMRHAVDEAEGAKSSFAVVVPVIDEERHDLEVLSPRQGNTVFGDIRRILCGVEDNAHVRGLPPK